MVAFTGNMVERTYAPGGMFCVRSLEEMALLAGTYDMPVGKRPEGSRFRRSYCVKCLAAIRVVKPRAAQLCEDCGVEANQPRSRIRPHRLPGFSVLDIPEDDDVGGTDA